jgi:AcrR family transcriptional regulator
MAKAPKTRKYSPRRSREERREQLLDAALVIVDSHGFGAFSIEAVAREAALAKTVVYASFDNPQDLLRALVDRELDRAVEDLATAIPRPPYEDPATVLQQALLEVLRCARRRPATWRIFVLPADGMPPAAREAVNHHHARFLRQIEPLVFWGLERLGSPQLDAELTTNILIAACEQGIRLALTDPERFTDERLMTFAGELVSTFLRPRLPE